VEETTLAAYPKAYIEYLVHFHGSRDWFECHEILEEYWKEDSDRGMASVWVGLIQIAVALYHERRGNLAGARKMLASAIDKCRDVDWSLLGVDGAELLNVLQEREQLLHSERPEGFVDLDIPLQDPELIQRCLQLCEQYGYTWKSASDMSNGELVHRHTRRDRSQVVEERRKQYELRRR
jgi:uncharacterized protein